MLALSRGELRLLCFFSMASFYRSTVREFLDDSVEHILATLATSYAQRGYTSQYSDQTLTWQRDLQQLREVLSECIAVRESAALWGLVLEFLIPRKERRIDVVLLIRETIVVVEEKTRTVDSSAERQIEEYSLLLHYFHKASRDRIIVPLLISSVESSTIPRSVEHQSQTNSAPSHWIAPVRSIVWQHLSRELLSVEDPSQPQIVVEVWDSSPYFPVPSIIDAAIALRSGLLIREIAHSEASEHEIETVCQTVQRCLELARTERQHAICFLTGVPGSGKTLVGLSLAHSSENKANSIHFMSGNGPLVKVLQHLFTQEARKGGKSASEARIEARTLIENVHVFARNYSEDDPGPPSNHAIIFDEAQRAWNQAQNSKKFKRNYSEPEMLLRIMERHDDWAMVVALVGGGQEINDGEAGLGEWGKALSSAKKKWQIYASPEVLQGGPSTAGQKLFDWVCDVSLVRTDPTLHLRTSNRSIRAENLATWVNHVLDGESERAASLGIADRFPIFLTRSLVVARQRLQIERIGETRYGLVGSSGATRLRAVGLEPNSSFHADYPWEHWYLAKGSDIRSSYRCEVFATEFEIQGLELDWIGLCWGGDLIWSRSGKWNLRSLLHGPISRWVPIKNSEKIRYRTNAYRVLLTRARQGLVIYVPAGDEFDSTNLPDDFDATAAYLLSCGAISID